MNINKFIPLIIAIVIGICSISAVVLAQQATEPEPVQQEVLNVEQQEEMPDVEQNVEQEPIQREVQDISVGEDEVIYATENRKLFLSPDKKYIAVTILGKEFGSKTHIEDSTGKEIVPPHDGYFVTWSPDNKKVLLYLSIEETGKSREIYSLSIDGTYMNYGLPSGVAAADISIKGEVVYSLTDSASDDSDIYIRNSEGRDVLVKKGSKSIFGWLRWSPDGSKFAVLKADLGLSTESKELWVFEPSKSLTQNVSKVAWAYPPVWSVDGSRILFSNQGQIWEYSTITNELLQLTKLENASAKHPTYTANGAILFSDSKQIWSVDNGDVKPLTSSTENKLFPLAL